MHFAWSEDCAPQGTNSSLQVITKDPDLELVPDGGFNPMSGGAVTPPDDPSFYIGQMDTISRISRMHSIWIQTLKSGPNPVDFLTPVIEPKATQQPVGTQLVFAYRGASNMGSTAATNAFDADLIDPYGDVRLNAGDFIGDNTGVSFFPPGQDTWSDSIDDIDGASFFQFRITFIGDPTTLISAELSGLGFAFQVQ